jgi:hypothetical protein
LIEEIEATGQQARASGFASVEYILRLAANKYSLVPECGSDLEPLIKEAYAAAKPIVAIDAPRRGALFARVSDCAGEKNSNDHDGRARVHPASPDRTVAVGQWSTLYPMLLHRHLL